MQIYARNLLINIFHKIYGLKSRHTLKAMFAAYIYNGGLMGLISVAISLVLAGSVVDHNVYTNLELPTFVAASG